MDKDKIINIGVFVVIIIIAVVAVISLANNKEKVNEVEKKEVENSMYLTGKHHAKLTIKDYGVIELELDADIAPITVTNFVNLVNDKFYDGLTFHRIIEGFMMQGGEGKDGKEANTIKGEFKENGVANSISHVRGVISMARTKVNDSASSQFFIVHKDSTFLDGKYAGFGHVTSGIEVVDKICEEAKVVDDNGTVLEENQPIIESIVMID